MLGSVAKVIFTVNLIKLILSDNNDYYYNLYLDRIKLGLLTLKLLSVKVL